MAEQAAGTAERKPRKELGAQRIAEAAIPDGIRNAASSKIGPEVNVQPAREDGSYKGKIVYANDRYLVQAVGKEGKSAVVHQRSDVEMVGDKMKWRAENGKLTNADMQIHYDGQAAKGYVWNREREQAARAERAAGATKDQAGAQRTPPADRSKDAAAPTADKSADARKPARSGPTAGGRKPEPAADRDNSRSASKTPAPAKAADKSAEPKSRAPRAPARQRQPERQQVAGGPER